MGINRFIDSTGMFFLVHSSHTALSRGRVGVEVLESGGGGF